MQMKLTMEVVHTGTEDQLPEIRVDYEVPGKHERTCYYRQAEGLWSTALGWPMGREFTHVAETLYSQAKRQEFNES